MRAELTSFSRACPEMRDETLHIVKAIFNNVISQRGKALKPLTTRDEFTKDDLSVAQIEQARETVLGASWSPAHIDQAHDIAMGESRILFEMRYFDVKRGKRGTGGELKAKWSDFTEP